MIRRRGGADAAGDVVVPREDVGHQRTEHVERGAVAEAPLQLHVVFDLVERHVPGPFDHHLHAVGPRPLGQLADGLQLGQLGLIGRVGQPARAQPVADREGHVVAAHDLADLVPQLVHRVLAPVREHPLGQQRAAAGDDADEAISHVLEMARGARPRAR